MRLQIFAEGDGAGAGEGSNGGGSGTGGEGEPGAGTGPMSFDDFLKGEGNQAEFDRRVQKAIDTAVPASRPVLCGSPGRLLSSWSAALRTPHPTP